MRIEVKWLNSKIWAFSAVFFLALYADQLFSNSKSGITISNQLKLNSFATNQTRKLHHQQSRVRLTIMRIQLIICIAAVAVARNEYVDVYSNTETPVSSHRGSQGDYGGGSRDNGGRGGIGGGFRGDSRGDSGGATLAPARPDAKTLALTLCESHRECIPVSVVGVGTFVAYVDANEICAGNREGKCPEPQALGICEQTNETCFLEDNVACLTGPTGIRSCGIVKIPIVPSALYSSNRSLGKLTYGNWVGTQIHESTSLKPKH